MPTIASLILQLLPHWWNWMGNTTWNCSMVQRLPLKIWPCPSCHTLWQQPLKSMVLENKIVILTATSGDTGKAAMAGVCRCAWNWDYRLLSERRCQQGTRVANDHSDWRQYHVIAIDGNFDDAQTNVKHMFNDVELREKLAANKLNFSSANSLWTLVVWYHRLFIMFMPTLSLVKSGEIVAGERSTSQYQQETLEIFWLPFMLNKSVYQLANWSVLQMTTMFWQTSLKLVFTTRNVSLKWPLAHLWISWYLQTWSVWFSIFWGMMRLRQLNSWMPWTQGQYELTDFDAAILGTFAAEYATEEETAAEIKRVYEQMPILRDPHTAVASAVYRKIPSGYWGCG